MSISTLVVLKEKAANRFARQVQGRAMPQRVGCCEIQKEYVPLHQQTQGDLSLWSGNVATLIADALMVIIAQLVRASDCGSEGRGFESHWSPYSFARFFLFSVLASLFRSVFDYNFLFEVAKA